MPLKEPAAVGQLHVIGLGISQPPMLLPQALSALNQADIVIGSDRQLDSVGAWVDGETLSLPKLKALKPLLKERLLQGQTCIVLASGDPLFYGIGAWLGRHFGADNCVFYPAVSSLQGVCHRLGLSLQTLTTVSLHGRPLATLRRHLGRAKTLLLLTDKQSQPQHIATLCVEAGFAESELTVCERLGYTDERITGYSAADLSDRSLEFSPLNVVVLKVQGLGNVLPEFPGIPDPYFSTGAAPGKGMISKREVRLAILSAMQTAAGDVVWDIGAGCGGVAVELARWAPAAKVYAVEHHPERLKHLAINQTRFGVLDNLLIHEGTAPRCLADLPSPSKIFIGGSDGHLPELLSQCWQCLPVGGRLVVSAVIEPSKVIIDTFATAVSKAGNATIDTVELAVKRGHYTGGEHHQSSRLPVLIATFEKRSLGVNPV